MVVNLLFRMVMFILITSLLGDLNISGGSLDIDGNYIASGNVNANITGGIIKVEGNWTSSGVDLTQLVEQWFRSLAQTISIAAGNNFYDLTINNSNANAIGNVSAQEVL